MPCKAWVLYLLCAMGNSIAYLGVGVNQEAIFRRFSPTVLTDVQPGFRFHAASERIENRENFMRFSFQKELSDV